VGTTDTSPDPETAKGYRDLAQNIWQTFDRRDVGTWHRCRSHVWGWRDPRRF